MAAYAEHANNIGKEDKTINAFIYEALCATLDDTLSADALVWLMSVVRSHTNAARLPRSSASNPVNEVMVTTRSAQCRQAAMSARETVASASRAAAAGAAPRRRPASVSGWGL